MFASYYVDESVLVRAARTGRPDDDDALDPDPWATSEPVDCFA
ncbi:hypothetical protein [Halorussus halobius]|nr:hypothetical protein [Halorussus halobius]